MHGRYEVTMLLTDAKYRTIIHANSIQQAKQLAESTNKGKAIDAVFLPSIHSNEPSTKRW